jgi:hypothetical protein
MDVKTGGMQNNHNLFNRSHFNIACVQKFFAFWVFVWGEITSLSGQRFIPIIGLAGARIWRHGYHNTDHNKCRLFDSDCHTTSATNYLTHQFDHWNKYSRTPLIRTLVIRIANYPDRPGPSGKYVDNSTELTYFEITGYRIKYCTVLHPFISHKGP